MKENKELKLDELENVNGGTSPESKLLPSESGWGNKRPNGTHGTRYPNDEEMNPFDTYNPQSSLK